jgi:UDP-glucose 4-epimerase
MAPCYRARMRVLVTGGAGFIGSHIADAAIELKHDVLVVDDLSTGKAANVPKAAQFAQLDIRDGAKLTEAIARFRPDVISHQAAQTSVAISARDPLRDAEINIIGSINLFDAAVAHGVARVIFASTGGAIYGEVPDGTRAKETDAPTPLSPYACSKRAVETYLRGHYAVEHGLKSTVLRYANVYGPRQDPHGEAGVVAIFAQRLKAGDPIQINAMREPGDSGCIRDYVYVEDVVRANIAAIDGHITAPIMNVCSGEATSTSELAEVLQRELGHASEVKAGPRRAGDLGRSVLDPTHCLSVLGRITSRDEGLTKTAAWFKAH